MKKYYNFLIAMKPSTLEENFQTFKIIIQLLRVDSKTRFLYPICFFHNQCICHCTWIIFYYSIIQAKITCLLSTSYQIQDEVMNGLQKRMNFFAPKILERREKVDCLKRIVLNYSFSCEIKCILVYSIS